MISYKSGEEMPRYNRKMDKDFYIHQYDMQDILETISILIF